MLASSSQLSPVTPPPFSRGSSSRRYPRSVPRPALFQFPSTSTSCPRAEPPSLDRDFGQLLGSNLGSPFVTTKDLPDVPGIELDMVDGALSAVPRSFTVTRPTSPVLSMDFSMVSRPNSAMYEDFLNATPNPSFFATPTKRGLYSSTSFGPVSGSSPPSNLKNILPRLWDALSSPGRKGRGKATRNDSSFNFDGYSYGDLPPLDGEEGELIDDEACLIEVVDIRNVRAVTGIDVLAQIPPEVALYLLLFLDLPSILACMAVSRAWRALAEDNAVWRELFHRHDGWDIDLARARARGWTPSSRDSTTEFSFYTAPTSNRTSKLGHVIEEWGRRRLISQVTAKRSTSLSPRTITSPASWRQSKESEASVDGSGDVAPLMLDWRALYKSRRVLDHRWIHEEPKVARISGHADSVYCLEFDSTRIITGSRDRSIKVWSLLNGKLLATFWGHAGSVLCLKFDKDWDVKGAAGEQDENKGEVKPGFMVSGSSDWSICVWDLSVGRDGEVDAEVRGVLQGHTGGVLDLRIDDQWIVSCSKDALIRVWNRETLALHCTLRGHEGPVNAIGLQASRVVSASGDGKMILWDIDSGERLRTFEGHDRGLACIEFKDDLIVSGSNDCKIKIWSASTGECVRTLVGHDLLVRALSFDPANSRLVSASYDRTVKVWDLRTGKMAREFRNSHVSHIFDVKFDVARIVSTSHDQKIVVLDFSQDLDGAALFV